MGKAYSTQLKICNDTSSTISTTVSRVKAGDFLGPQTPEQNFHRIRIAPGSEYSREHVINLRRPATVFTLTLRFEKDKEAKPKELLFRIDQGRVAEKRRNQCRRHKEKNIFEFVGDENAFDVKDTIAGNTLTIRIKDSYMYEFGNKESMRKKAEQISALQRKAAEQAVVKAEAAKSVKRAAEEAKKREEEKEAREEEEMQTAKLLLVEMARLADAERQQMVESEEVRTRDERDSAIRAESGEGGRLEEEQSGGSGIEQVSEELTGSGSVSGMERRRTED